MKKYLLILLFVIIALGSSPVAHAQYGSLYPINSTSASQSTSGGCPSGTVPMAGVAGGCEATSPAAAGSNTGGNIYVNKAVPTSGNGNLQYTPLEPIPGVTTGTDLTNPNNLGAIVNAIFTVLITVAALLAVLSLTIGGIEYMIGNGASEKNKGIKRAQASMWGIVLIAASWLILHTINPQLVNINLNPCQYVTNGSNNCAVTGSSTVAPITNTGSGNSGTGLSGTVSSYANTISNDTPNAAECETAEIGTGARSITSASSLTALGNVFVAGASQTYYITKAAFWDNGINNTPTNMVNISSDALNQMYNAEQAYVANCQAAGL